MTDDLESDAVELLDVALLEEHSSLREEIVLLASSLGIELGWHYLLDLIWILAKSGSVEGRTIVDAGAGWGLLQWALAERGATVISVDRDPRGFFSDRIERRYRIRGLRACDREPARLGSTTGRHTFRKMPSRLYRASRRLARVTLDGLRLKARGEVVVYNTELHSLPDIASDLVDMVVSVSALEHNPLEETGPIVDELTRVLKPGGSMLATVSATGGEDFWHAPSRGWCLGEKTLRRVFRLSSDAATNFTEFDDLFAQLVACRDLRDNLASFYARSGQNGMPWGVWDPRYHPVGLVRRKAG